MNPTVQFTLNYLINNLQDNSEVFTDGYMMDERRLCDYIGVARQTLREALFILKWEGFISGGHGKRKRLLKEMQASELAEIMKKVGRVYGKR